jgi:DHA3 family macrolide efflux protein-like MFS transporter
VPILGVFLGLGLGLLVGGSIDNLVHVRLRWLPLLVGAAAARFGLDLALASSTVPDSLRLWLVIVTYVLLTVMLLLNRDLPGLTAAALGTAANGIAIVANGGWMPVWQSSMKAAGLDSTVVHSGFHRILTGPLDTSFFEHGGPLVDIIPIPIPILQSVASIGDVLLAAGLGLFVFASLVRNPVAVVERWRLSPSGIAAPIPGPAPDIGVEAPIEERGGALSHPYVRLAANTSFSAMWLGQIISSLGDRIHQVALVYLVLGATDSSPFALGVVFAALTVPAVFVGPVAGALVDRWDRKRVLVASDLIRGGIVALIPVASGIHVSVVVLLVFLLAATSTFFRPARTAALPQVVPDEDLMTANSAMWLADTGSDLIGYSLGGAFVAFLGSQLAMAFWVDGASYLASAMLVAAVAIPPLASTAEAQAASLRADLAAGWRFLRSETVLLATTLQASVAEYGLGALTALSPLLIAALPLGDVEAPTAYGLFEMAMGIGAVGGGVLIGGIAGRMPKGRSIIAAFASLGVLVVTLAFAHSLALALILAAGVGIANVTFVIPSQTIFQQRTPGELLGRVVAIRLAVVSGALALAMITSGALAELVGFQPMLAACGTLTLAAGLAGLLVRSIRDA